MSILRTVPKSALFREVSAKFVFDYQTAGIYAGTYVCASGIYQVLPMNLNTYYLIDSCSISGSIAENIFVDSLTSDFITFELRRYQRNELITAQPFVISQYYKDKGISTHVQCDRNNDGVAIKINGHLEQVAETVGVDEISIAISLSTYEIDGKEYNTFFRDKDIIK